MSQTATYSVEKYVIGESTGIIWSSVDRVPFTWDEINLMYTFVLEQAEADPSLDKLARELAKLLDL